MQSFSMQGHKRVHHVNFLQPCYRGLQHFSFPEYSENSGKCISITLSTHVETVVLLSKGMVDSRKVKVDFSLEDMDLSEFKGKATYEQIKTYVLEETGLKVSSLYIAQIKKKCGLDVGENFNPAKSENARQPQCTPEKEDAIMQAFSHFGIIQIVDKQHRVLKIQ